MFSILIIHITIILLLKWISNEKTLLICACFNLTEILSADAQQTAVPHWMTWYGSENTRHFNMLSSSITINLNRTTADMIHTCHRGCPMQVDSIKQDWLGIRNKANSTYNEYNAFRFCAWLLQHYIQVWSVHSRRQTMV